MADGYARRSSTDVDRQPVAVTAVDTVKRVATVMTRVKTEISVDCSFSTGDTTITPAVGEQWYIERFDGVWRLYGRIPFNDPTLLTEAVEGQVSVGGASGPLELHGTSVNAHGSISIPDDSDLVLGSNHYRTSSGGVLEYSIDGGTTWSRVGPTTTDDLPEGSVNLYFTDQRASAASPVQSVSGRTGAVILTSLDVGLGNVSNLAPADLPVSTATAAALALKADLSGGTVPDGQIGNIATSKVTGLDGILSDFGGNFQGIFDAFKGGGGGVLGDVGNKLSDFVNEITGNSSDIQSLLSSIFGGITGGSLDPLENLFNQITDALNSIPFGNVSGIGGPIDIGGSVQSTLDQFVGGAVGVPGFNASLADMFNVSYIVSSFAQLGLQSFNILGIRNNKSLNTGFIPSALSNFGLDTVALQPTAPTFGVDQSTAITAYHRISEASDFGVVSWQGFGVSSITDAFMTIFKMDTTTGQKEVVHVSGNIAGTLAGTMQQNIYTISPAIPVKPGEVFGTELSVIGAGTHSIVGKSSWLVDQAAYPRRFSSVRDSGTSPLSVGDVITPSYGSNVPFMEFGVSAGNVDLPHPPDLRTVVTSQSLPIPDWANSVQIIALGAGGGGNGGGVYGIQGEGGDAGSYSATTWVRGTHFSGTPSITFTIGTGGNGGGAGSVGSAGTSSTASITGYSVTGTGGAGGNRLIAVGDTDMYGDSPGNYTYDLIPYVGGGQQKSYSSDGTAPGGGGAGGNYITASPGGKGGGGVVWARFLQ